MALADGASSVLATTSGAALGITNGGAFPTNVFLDSIVLTGANTAQLTIVNESGNDVSSFNVDVKAVDYSGVAGPVTPKQTEFGAQAAAAYETFQTYVITFATAFPTVPFVTLTSSIKEDMLSWKALDITTTGFTLEGYGFSSNPYTGNVNWKAEEK